jgi:16S rRNA (cytosine967-C5)-methyltransferase
LAKPSVRLAAVKVIEKILRQQSSLLYLLNESAKQFEAQDARLLKALCYGTLREALSLDAVIKRYLAKPLKTKDADIQAALLVGAYQLLHSAVADHAAINETAGLAKKLKKPWATKLINGVLRTIQREGAPNFSPSSWQPASTKHPLWLVDRWRADWGDECARNIVNANNERAPMTLRINVRKSSVDDYSKQLNALGIDHSIGALSASAIILDAPCNVEELPLWFEGGVSIQDEAAQLSGHILAKLPGKIGVDACAAPGGKTCHWLEVKPELQLTAIELEASRSSRIHENLERLQLSASVKVADAGDIDHWWNGTPVDLLLLDAPCSATGVIRRHPDIRLLRDAAQISELTEIQSSILKRIWPTIADGGYLLYATCSTLKAENENAVASFLAKADDAVYTEIEILGDAPTEYGVQFFPKTGGHDGFYYALIQKRPKE